MFRHQKNLRQKARHEAQKLFSCLFRRHRPLPNDNGIAEVVYPERFGHGKFCVSVMAPAGNMKYSDINRIAASSKHRDLFATTDSGRACLRITFAFPDITPGDEKKSLECAQSVAKWTEDKFGMSSVISSTGGIVGMRWRLRI